jgi:hypothetical protein
MIVLKYALTPEDHYKFNYYRLWQSPSKKDARVKAYVRFVLYTTLGIVFIHIALVNRPASLQDIAVAGLLCWLDAYLCRKDIGTRLSGKLINYWPMKKMLVI